MKYLTILFITVAHLTSGQSLFLYNNAKDGSYSTIAPNTASNGLQRVNGAKKPSFMCSTGFSSSNYPKSASWKDNGAAVQFTITPDTGYRMTIKSLSGGIRRSDTGTLDVLPAYSLDGVTWTPFTVQNPKKGSCGDVSTFLWDIVDFTIESKLWVRLYGLNAKSGAGVLQLMNINLEGACDLIFVDMDKDGYAAEQDCDDSDSAVHPGATETCNGIDEDCDTFIDNHLPIFIYYADKNGDGYGEDSSIFILTCKDTPPAGYVWEMAPKPEMTITTTGVPVNPNLWGATVADLAYTGSLTDCKADGRVTASEPIYGLIKGFNWNFISYSEGQTVQVDWCRIGDTTVLRTCIKGEKTGYNCNSPLAIKGACNCDYKVDGKCLDFFNDAVELKRKLGVGGIVTVNIESGTPTEQLDQLAWKIQRFNPSKIIMGQEENAQKGHFDGDPNKYIAACKPLCDFVRATYPWIRIIGDAAPIESTAKGNVLWNKAVMVSTLFDEFDAYAQLDEVTEFNGVVSHDTTELNKVEAVLVGRLDAIYAQSHKPTFWTQENASETFSDEGSVVYEGQAMAGFYVADLYRIGLKYAATSPDKFSGGIWQTVKNVTGKNVLDLNGKILYLIGNLFSEEAINITITENCGAVMYGVKTDTEYRIIMFNKTGKDVTLPTVLSIDGKIMVDVKWNSGTWYGVGSYTDKVLNEYDNVGKMKFGFGYATIKTN